jgi:hypothetical protein
VRPPYPPSYPPPPAAPPPARNTGLNFAGWMIGILLALAVAVPVLFTLACLATGLLGAATDAGSTP